MTLEQKQSGEMTLKGFRRLPYRKIREIVSQTGRPKTVMVVPDNIRRTGITYWGMMPDAPDFEDQLFRRLNIPYIRLLENIFKTGVKTIVAPSLTHGNLRRSDKYVKTHLRYANYMVYKGDPWLNFYKRSGVRVKIYGDRELFNQVASAHGYPEAIKWCDELERETSKNKDHLLLWGLACSGTPETERLVNLGIEFFQRTGRRPTQEDLVKIYFGESIDAIDIFLRPGELRDSDCQPPLISGRSEMYFPVAPLTQLKSDFFKDVLYDYLFCRIRSFSRKEYRDTNTSPEVVEKVKHHFEARRDSIIGVGERIGRFWLPKEES